MLLSLCFLALSTFAAIGQNIKASGTVVDETGAPMIGVGVVQKGTSNGVITDLDGKFEISVPVGSILEFSSVSFKTQELIATTDMQVVLVEDREMLDEVVVVGYGVQKKSDVTGAISQVKSEDMESRSIARADQALQGKTAGVVIMMGSAAPGSSPTVRVRGFSSNAASDPLYVVDGLRVSSRDIGGIDPNTIESMEVLKDAASAAIYGAQAGNGVVLITTKKGQKGTTKVSYELQHTIQSIAYIPEVLNAADYITFYKEKYAATGSFDTLLSTQYDGKTDTDWVKEAFETSHMSRHSLNFSAANDHGSYLLSMSYMDNNGIMKGDKDTFNRVTLTFNGDYKFTKWLNISSNVSLDKSVTNNSITEGSLFGGYTSATLMTDPLTPVYGISDYMQQNLDAGYNLLGDENGYYYVSEFFGSQNAHPLVSQAASDSVNKRFQIRGNISLNLTPIKGLTFTSRLGYRFSGSYSNSFSYKYIYNSQRKSDHNTVNSSTSLLQYYQWENFANYTFNLGKNNFTAMVGMSFDETNSSSVGASADEIMKEDDLFHYLNYKDPAATLTNSGDDIYNRNLSYFGRLNWDYDGKYMAQASLRADAADLSKLSPSARWGYFPAVSVGWVISKEKFFGNLINPDVLSFMKLRASWGQNGSIAGLGSYMWRSAIDNTGFYFLDDAVTPAPTTGMKPSTLGNDELTWETSEQLDLGVDLRFFNSKLTMTADYYVKKTKDLIVSGAVPSLVVGNDASPINGGNVENKGFEFEATWRGSVGKDFNYSISGNIATLHNEVTYVSEFVSGKLSGASMNTYQQLTMFEAGYPVWYFNGWHFTGLNKENGYPEFEDLNDDGIISDVDKSFIGSAIPDFTYGITLTANWKNFDALIFGTGSHGNQVYQWLTRPDNPGSNILQNCFDNRWTASNTNGTYPAADTPADILAHYTYSNANVKDGSFFKVKQIQLGYRLPKNLISHIALSSARAYISLEDFLIFTPYDGFDPEATSASRSVKQAGIDAGSYPTSKKIILGLNISF